MNLYTSITHSCVDMCRLCWPQSSCACRYTHESCWQILTIYIFKTLHTLIVSCCYYHLVSCSTFREIANIRWQWKQNLVLTKAQIYYEAESQTACFPLDLTRSTRSMWICCWSRYPWKRYVTTCNNTRVDGPLSWAWNSFSMLSGSWRNRGFCWEIVEMQWTLWLWFLIYFNH